MQRGSPGLPLFPYSPECAEREFSEVRRFLDALMCFVPWRTYTTLAQE